MGGLLQCLSLALVYDSPRRPGLSRLVKRRTCSRRYLLKLARQLPEPGDDRKDKCRRPERPIAGFQDKSRNPDTLDKGSGSNVNIVFMLSLEHFQA